MNIKNIVAALLIGVTLFASVEAGRKSTIAKANPEEKWICSIGDMSDAVFTEEYATKEECSKYCKGIATVCERTGIKTNVNLTDVD